MKGKSFAINNLENQRYFVVTAHNVVEVTQLTSVFAGSNPTELILAFSYTELFDRLKQKFSIDASPSTSSLQQYRNHLSTLNSYLVFCGKSLESNVGTELGGQFEAKLRTYLDNIDVAPRTRRDRAQQLTAIHKLHKAMLNSRQRPEGKTGNLAEMLRLRIAESGVPPKTLAKQAGVDPTTVWRWLRGARPRDDTLPSLRRLEKRLGLTRDTLVQLIDKRIPDEPKPPPTIPSYRARMSARPKHRLVIPEVELTTEFRQEWRMLFDYKTSNFPMLERQSRGHWRLIPKSVARTITSLALRGDMACPTAGIFAERMRSFLGVLTNLPVELGGMAWEEAPPQTLAWCAHPQALDCYLRWQTDQSNGIRHNGQKVFARAVASLLRPQTGFLWQQASMYRERLPPSFRPATDDDWRAMCAKSHKFLRDYMRGSTGVSRNPEEPIADLLALPNPLQPVRDAIASLESAAAAAPPGSKSEARHKRNALVLALLLSNPLRARTLTSLTWLSNGQGTLRGSSTQGWRIQLAPVHLKTGNTLRGRAYDVKVANWVKPMLDEYIEEYRETLLDGKSSPYLLVGEKDGSMWEEMGRTVRVITRRHIPGSPGFGPHALRHLVATDWLRKHPGDFLTVSELLNDTLPTVLACYAHLRRDDSFSRYEAYLTAPNAA